MIVERIWTGNAYRNYNYLIACPETGDALAIDPLDHEKCLNTARVKGWRISQVLNTHEHHDHTGGNAAVIAATGAKLIAHHRAGARIAGVRHGGVARLLEAEEARLRERVRLDVRVAIEVVRGDVEDRRDAGAERGQPLDLEGRELEHHRLGAHA